MIYETSENSIRYFNDNNLLPSSCRLNLSLKSCLAEALYIKKYL